MSGTLAVTEHKQETTTHASSTSTSSNDSRNEVQCRNKVQCCNAVRYMLLRFLLCQGEFSNYFVHHIAQLLGIEQTSMLMTTCRAMYNEDVVLYRAPKIWTNNNESRKMVRAMVVMSPRWTSWLCTSKVEEMMLGIDDWSGRAGVVTDEWIRFIVRSGKFPRLNSINLRYCSNVSNASLIEIAQGLPQLTSIKFPGKVTNASLIAIARGCPQLTFINLFCCRKITDTSVLEIARRCPRLTSINLGLCNKITDIGIIGLARRCPQLTSIDLYGCGRTITNASVIELARGCPQLKSVVFSCCDNITLAFINALKKEYPQLNVKK